MSKPHSAFIWFVFILKWHLVAVQSIFLAFRSSLLQSAGSASIEKAEPPWPIQQPPRADPAQNEFLKPFGEESCRAGAVPTGILRPEDSSICSTWNQTWETTLYLSKNNPENNPYLFCNHSSRKQILPFTFMAMFTQNSSRLQGNDMSWWQVDPCSDVPYSRFLDRAFPVKGFRVSGSLWRPVNSIDGSLTKHQQPWMCVFLLCVDQVLIFKIWWTNF